MPRLLTKCCCSINLQTVGEWHSKCYHNVAMDRRDNNTKKARPIPKLNYMENTGGVGETAVDIIEGRNPVIEALRSGRPLTRLLLARTTTGRGAITEVIQLAREHGVPVEYVERQTIERMSATGASQGIIACAAAKEYAGLDDLLAIPQEKGESALFVVLDGVEDPRNLGAVLRTADATGVHGVIIRSRRAVGLTSTVGKTSAGAIEYVPVARVANIYQAIEKLKKNNVWVTGIDMSGKVDYTGVDFKPPTAIVLGGEGAGLSALVRKSCDSLASIPMKGKVTSLNISIAAAVVLYEVLRQRSK